MFSAQIVIDADYTDTGWEVTYRHALRGGLRARVRFGPKDRIATFTDLSDYDLLHHTYIARMVAESLIRQRDNDTNGVGDDDGGNGFPVDDPEILPDGSPVEPSND